MPDTLLYFSYFYALIEFFSKILLMKNLMEQLRIFFCFLLFAALSGKVGGQMPSRSANPVAVIGWSDDSHYLLRSTDTSGKAIIHNVDIKTGKKVTADLPESPREQFVASLPENWKCAGCPGHQYQFAPGRNVSPGRLLPFG